MKHYHPDHPRYCSPERWDRIKRMRPRNYRSKLSGCREISLFKVKHPRKRDNEGDLEREFSGACIVRVDNHGDRYPRARKMEVGVTGKSFRRKMRTEARLERQAANAA